jgi:hypothetical protein
MYFRQNRPISANANPLKANKINKCAPSQQVRQELLRNAQKTLCRKRNSEYKAANFNPLLSPYGIK